MLLEAENLSIQYNGKSVCAPVSFQVHTGDRILLSGRNGCGKTSILKLLNGARIDFTGNLRIGSNLIISYIPQDTSFLNGGLKDFPV